MTSSIDQPSTLEVPPRGRLLEVLGWVGSENPFVNDALEQRVRSMARNWALLLVGLFPAAFFLAAPISAGKVALVPLLCGFGVPVLALIGAKFSFITSQKPHIRSIIHSLGSAVLGFALSLVIREAAVLPEAPVAFLVLGATMMILVAGLSRLPGAMLAFPLGLMAMGPPLGEGLLVWVLSLMLLFCMGALAVNMAHTEYGINFERWQANRRAHRSNRLIDQFENHGTGWFWETDRDGAITYISAKAANLFKVSAEEMVGVPVASIGRVDRDKSAGERSLGFYISTRAPFSELAVPANIPGEERWWSVTGRPVLDKFGQFRGFIGTGTDLTEKRRSEAEVEKLARFDSLTGLANRAETANVLARALGASPQGVRPTGLMLIDLDRFKAVNDTLGHPVGDELLRQVSARFSQIVGSEGQVGRLGGDEFKIVFPNLCDREKLSVIARAIIEAASQPFYISQPPVRIGASVGIAIAPDDGSTIEELVRNADLALYAAKGAGRGIHRFYQRSMHSVAEERQRLEHDMRQALTEGQFRMVYQPIVSLENEKIIGFEALIRWNHPTRGPVSPADFIPIAEENGMIEAIGEWALRTSAAEAASWAVEARVAVNVSAIQFANPKFPELVANVLAQSGLAKERLELEITESVFVSDTDAIDRQFDLLKKLGVRLALDDFGTGYSSLGYLKRAPFDKIKIDQSFVRGASLGQDKNSAIIRAIVTLAETMNMETTAEGVETQDEIDFIRKLGCSHIQGFVFGKPNEATELRERLGQRGDAADRLGPKATREARMRVFRVATMEINGRQHPVRLRNLSNGGVMVEGPTWVVSNTRIGIDIVDGMTVDGVVRWADDGRIGIQFNHRIEVGKVIPQARIAG